MISPRRRVLTAATIAVIAVSGCVGDDDDDTGDQNDVDDGEPGSPEERVDAFLTGQEANLYDRTIEDLTGEAEVTVAVGAEDRGDAFDPVAFRIATETTVVWEWTGEGGGHNVVPIRAPTSKNSGSER